MKKIVFFFCILCSAFQVKAELLQNVSGNIVKSTPLYKSNLYKVSSQELISELSKSKKCNSTVKSGDGNIFYTKCDFRNPAIFSFTIIYRDGKAIIKNHVNSTSYKMFDEQKCIRVQKKSLPDLSTRKVDVANVYISKKNFNVYKECIE